MATAGLVAALVLYLIGVRWPLLAALVALNALFLPMPQSVASWLGRCFGGALIVFALVQVAATAQFFLAPHTDFRVVAWLLVAANLALVAPALSRPLARRAALSFDDVCALVPGLLFLVPFGVAFHHVGGITSGIAEIAGIQILDATSHSFMVTSYLAGQHFDYGSGAPYYPNGFHLAAAFVEDGVLGNVYRLGWDANALIYFGQYVAGAFAIGAAVYYLTAALVSGFQGFAALGRWQRATIAAALSPSLVLFYLLSLVRLGFVNYAYALATVMLGLCFLVGTEADEAGHRSPLWGSLGFLVLAFGASATWPLLAPPLLLTGGAAVLAGLPAARRRGGRIGRALPTALLLAFLVNLVPVYLQLRYGDRSVLGDLSIGGNQIALHPLVLTLGVAAVASILVDRHLEPAARRAVGVIMIPLLAAVAAIALIEIFQTGQPSYYAAKLSIPVQILVLCLAVALACSRIDQVLTYRPLVAGALAALVLIGAAFALSVDGSPLQDARSLFPDYSGTVKPPMYDHDRKLLVWLGDAGKLKDANATAIHVDQAGNLYQHEPLPYWADLMQFDAATPAGRAAQSCVGNLYPMLSFGDVNSAANQAAVVAQVRECAALARDRGQAFYIVTDTASAGQVSTLFGSVATIVDR